MANRFYNGPKQQSGASLVEFAVTISFFLLVVIAIAEFSILIMNVSRANELTRQLNRVAIVGTPVCDIFGGGCPGPESQLVCPGGGDVVVDLAQIGVNGCSSDPDPTECRMWSAAQAYLPVVGADQIEVSYACSTAGSALRPQPVPYITVAIRNYNHQFAFASFLGINATLNIPDFEITRTGEDLFTERNP